ncbi:MAG: RsmB/NOP family class I SAM-dependent RNA methyltransferase [Saccharospirillum sp.]|nr:RsmB/NOP family class I SAM-dependent RNA methyltransferase [Saccharospirillum sp.]
MPSQQTLYTLWPGFRWSHLLALTDRFLGEAQWPQTDRWLTAYFAEHKAFGGKDRAFYREKLFRLCRQAPLVVALQQGYAKHSFESELADIWTGLGDMPSAELWSWLVLLDNQPERLPREIEDGQQRLNFLQQCQRDFPERFESLSQGWLPGWQPWLERRAQQSQWSDAQRRHWLAMQNQRPPLWLWCMPGEVAWARASLEAEGFVVLAERGAALALEPDSRLHRSEAWQKGVIEIQDLASQAVVTAVGAQSGERIWDACAGAGGKALALAIQVGQQGLVVATDLRAHALRETQRRAQRLGLSQLVVDVWDAQQSAAPARECDRVLVDAPCTGAGTWRRSPDARWRLNDALLGELTELQDRILAEASAAVRPGGHLIYATCSWLVEENEDRVAKFLQANAAFQLIDQRLLGAPGLDADTLFAATLYRTEP